MTIDAAAPATLEVPGPCRTCCYWGQDVERAARSTPRSCAHPVHGTLAQIFWPTAGCSRRIPVS